MTVATYFEPLFGYASSNHADLVALWTTTWINLGCAVRVLNRGNAEQHPAFEQMRQQAATLPTVNPRNYEEACFLRWCAVAALAQAEPVVFMDYDVFPTEHFAGWPAAATLTNFNHIPSCVMANKAGYARIVDYLLNHKLVPETKHTSDMHILWGLRWDAQLPWLKCYGVRDWEAAPLVHFANWYMPPGLARAERVQTLLQHGKVRCDMPYRLTEEQFKQLEAPTT